MTEEKKTFTKEDAKALSIVDVAEGLGMVLKRNSQREYYWEEHDSLKINVQKNRFDWYSRDLHGDAIALVQAVKEVSFKEALHYLKTGSFETFTAPEIKQEPFRYFLSRYEEPFQEARNYLREVRGLDDRTIGFARQAGVIAQAKKKAPDNYLESVVVFKSFDRRGKMVGASLQGIVPNKERYEKKGYLKQILANSDGLAGMSLDIGTPKRLIFTEAPIDLLSYYEVNRAVLSDVRLVSMDGLKEGVIARYTLELLAEQSGNRDYQVDRSKLSQSLEALCKTTTFFKKEENQNFITLAIDNDQAAVDFMADLKERGIIFQEDLPQKAEGVEKSDWNDVVKQVKQVNRQELTEHLATVARRDLPLNIQGSEKVQALLAEVEALGETAYFWVSEEDLNQTSEVALHVDDWFSSGNVDQTYQSDRFELTTGDYTYMLEFKDGDISLQNMADYADYISEQIDRVGLNAAVLELEATIADFNQVKEAITQGMENKLKEIKSEEYLVQLADVKQDRKQGTEKSPEGVQETVRNSELSQDDEIEVKGSKEGMATDTNKILSEEQRKLNVTLFSTDSEVVLNHFAVGETISYMDFVNILYPENTRLFQDNPRSQPMITIGGGSDEGTWFNLQSEKGEVLIRRMRYDIGAEGESISDRLTGVLSPDYLEYAKGIDAGFEKLGYSAEESNDLGIEVKLYIDQKHVDTVDFNDLFDHTDIEMLANELGHTDLFHRQKEFELEINGKRLHQNQVDALISYVSNENLDGSRLIELLSSEQFSPEKYIKRGNIEEAAKKETKKAVEEIQAQKNAEGTIGDFPDEQGAAPLPEANLSQPLNDLSPNQTQPQPLLYFTTKEDGLSINKRYYHKASSKDIVKLNRYAQNLQQTANWYLENVADSNIIYLYQDGEDISSLSVQFGRDKFMHLTGVYPYRDGQTAEQTLLDFANGKGDFDSILIADKGAAFDKLKILPELEAITEADSFYFGDLSQVPKLHQLDLDKAIKSGDEDIVLAMKTVDGTTFPASLMKLRQPLAIQLENSQEERTILGVYRERDGQLEQLSINEEYIKDGGRELTTILEEARKEEQPLQASVEEMTEDKAAQFTGQLDAAKEMGISFFREHSAPEWQAFYERLNYFGDDFDLLVADGLAKGEVLLDSDFMVDWIDDSLYAQYGISSADVLNKKISNSDYQDKISTWLSTIEQKRQEFVAEKAAIQEAALDRDGDGYSDIVEESLGTDPLNPLSNPIHKTESEERRKAISELLESKDMAALSIHLKEGLHHYTSSEQYRTFLTAMSKFHDYSLGNILLMLDQNPDVSQVASYQSWKKNFGRQVQKGEKGMKIRVPMVVRLLDKNGQPRLDENGKEMTVTRFKLGTVFDVSQTEGKDLPQPIYNLEGGVTDYEHLYRAAREIAKEDGVSVSFKEIDSGSNGYFHFENKEIVIADKQMSEAQIMKTLFHEMAHSHLHGKEDGFTPNERELQAESIAYIVSSHVGIDTSEYSLGYLHSWSEDKGNYRDLEAQLKVIQTEAKSMIHRLDGQLEKIKTKSKTLDSLQEKLAATKKTVEANHKEKQEMEMGKEAKKPSQGKEI